MCRLIHEIRPRYAVVENVSALCIQGLESVLQDLAEIGYDAEWHCIPASAFGAPHQRDRIWIIAYPSGKRGSRGNVPEADRRSGDTRGKRAKVSQKEISNTNEKRWRKIQSKKEKPNVRLSSVSTCNLGDRSNWRIESKLGRVVDGIPNRMDRLRQLGNSVVPQIPYLIGISIIEMERDNNE
jgi:DNA (cytosine-5)-methyltransferase 1